MFLAWAGLIFAYLGEGELVPMDRWIALFDEIMREAPQFPSRGVETRVAGAMLVALTWRQPHHPQAAHWAERAIALARGHPDQALKMMTASNWLHYQAQAGDLMKAAVVVDEMRAVMQARDSSPTTAVNASMTVVWYEAMMALPSYRHTVTRMLELAQTIETVSEMFKEDWPTSAALWLQDGSVPKAGVLFRNPHGFAPKIHA